MRQEQIEQLSRWNAWANRQVFETLQRSGGEPPKALAAFQHVLEAEIVWLRRFANDSRPMLPLWGPAAMSNCDEWFAEMIERWREFPGSLGTEGLDRTFTYRNQSGNEYTNRLEEPLLHLLMHSSQYRGEAAGFLNDAGHTVPDMDYIFWLREGAPD